MARGCTRGRWANGVNEEETLQLVWAKDDARYLQFGKGSTLMQIRGN